MIDLRGQVAAVIGAEVACTSAKADTQVQKVMAFTRH